MHEHHATENDALIIEARHRLAEHETVAGEMLDDLASDDFRRSTNRPRNI